MLQQLEVSGDYTISATDPFKAVSKYWDRIVRPEQLMIAATQAMRVLMDPAETGAVTLALPQDVQAEAYDYPESFFARKVHYLDRRPPVQAAIERAAQQIARGRKPLIVAGGGVLYAEASTQLAEFAEVFGIPVAETQAGKSALAWDHPLNVGAIGVTGSLAANRLAREADMVIGVGTRFSDFTTASRSAFQHPEAAFININLNGMDAAKLGGEAILADAREGLQALQTALQGRQYHSGYGTSEIANLRDEWNAEVDRLYESAA